MTGSTLGDVTLAVHQVFIILPLAILVSAICPSRSRIDDIAPVFGTAHQIIVILQILLAQSGILTGIMQSLRHLCHGIIIIGIFQGTGSLLVGMKGFLHHILQRNIAIIHIRPDGTAPLSIPIILRQIRSRESVETHSLVSLGCIKIANTLDIRIGKSRTRMIANHRRRITVPAWEDRHPAAFLVHLNQRLHHLARHLRSDETIERQLCTIDVPHGEIAKFAKIRIGRNCIALGTQGSIAHLHGTCRKLRIIAIHITHLMREEGCTVESTIKLINLCHILAFHINGMKSVAPDSGSILHHAVEIQAAIHIVFCIEILHRIVAGCKGCTRHPLHRLTRSATEGEPGANAWFALHLQTSYHLLIALEDTVIHQVLLIISQDEMAGETCRFSPSLIDAMHRIITIDDMIDGINLDVSLSLIAVRIDDKMNQLILLRSNTEEGGMTQGCHLCLQMFILQANSIVVRMRDFIFMAECRSSLFRLQTELSTKRSHRERAIILRTSAHQPVAAAEALQMGILIIIRCDAFLFCILRLRSPEVLTIRNENSGDGLSMFLTTLSEHARSLGICLCRTHHRIDGIELADMFQAMNPLMHFLLPGIPGIVMCTIDHLTYGRKHDIPLIEHELHQHAILRILIEYHLEIGSHRNYAIHLFHFISQNHQTSLFTCSYRRNIYIKEERQKTVKSCIMTKAKCSR